MSSLIDEIKDVILSDERYRIAAAQEIKNYLKSVFGFSRYSLEDLYYDLGNKLYSPDFLGVAVNALLDIDEVKRDVKVNLAQKYICFALAYYESGQPIQFNDPWSSMEPVMVVEAAAYLDHEGLFDWDDGDTVEGIMALAHISGVAAKADFLSSLVRKINEDRRVLKELSSFLVRKGYFDIRRPEWDECGLAKMSKSVRNLVMNLGLLIDADFSSSSIAPIVKLNALTDSDLIAMFGSHMFNVKVGNEVVLHRELAIALYRERGIMLTTLFQAFEKCIKDKRDLFYVSAKVLGLLNASEKMGVEGRELAKQFRKYLLYYMETDMRLRVMKFVYRHTGDRSVLEDALKFKSHKIREWVQKESSNS